MTADRTVDQIEREQERIIKLNRKERLLQLENYKILLSNNPHARKLLWEILELCGIYYVTTNYETNQTFEDKGRRMVGIFIIELLDSISPTLYPELLLERGKENESNTTRSDESES